MLCYTLYILVVILKQGCAQTRPLAGGISNGLKYSQGAGGQIENNAIIVVRIHTSVDICLQIKARF